MTGRFKYLPLDSAITPDRAAHNGRVCSADETALNAKSMRKRERERERERGGEGIDPEGRLVL